jgi:hypothetical protein
MAEVEPIIHLQHLIHCTARGLTLHGSGPCRGVTMLCDGRGSFTLLGDVVSGLCLLAEHLCNQIHRADDGTLVGAQHLMGCLSQGLAAFRLLQQHADMLA